MEELRIIKEDTLKNKKLSKATLEIGKLLDEFRKNSFKIAKIIANVDEEKLYLEDGFKSVHEWTKEYFGIKKSMSYSLLKIGQTDTIEILDDKGRVIDYMSLTVDRDGLGFSVSQLIRMSSMDKAMRDALIAAGIITSYMSCKEIDNVIKLAKKEHDNIKIEDAENVDENENNDQESNDQESHEQEESNDKKYLLQVFDDKGEKVVELKINDKLLDEIIYYHY